MRRLGPLVVPTRGLSTLGLFVCSWLSGSAGLAAEPPFDFAPQEVSPSEGSWAFGRAMAIDGRTMVVGDLWDRSGLGSATVFFLELDGTWAERARLAPNDLTAAAEFGHSVAVSGNRVVVGAPFDAPDGVDSGSAYVYRRDAGEWTLEGKLTSSDREADDQFGVATAIDGSRVLVGARGEDDAPGLPFEAGAAYVYELDLDQWSERAKLTASDRTAFDEFGYSVALDGSTAIIGARKEKSPSGQWRGAAYVFEIAADVWSETTKLAPTEDASFWFGYSVALDGDVAWVGAPTDESAWRFARDEGGADQWGVTDIVYGDCPGPVVDLFGYSVSVSGRFAVVGTLGSGADLFEGGTLVERLAGEGCDIGLPGNDGFSVAISGANFGFGEPQGGHPITGSVWTHSAFDRIWELFVDEPFPGDAGVDNQLRVNGSVFGRTLELYGGLFPGTSAVDGCTEDTEIEVGGWALDVLDPVDAGDYPAIYGLPPESVFVSYLNEGTGTQRLARSDDLGETWTHSDIEQTFGEDFSSSIVAVDEQTLFVSFMDTQDQDLLVARSTDGGASWTTEVVDPSGDAGAGSSIEAVDASTLFVSYSVFAPEEDLRVARSIDGGATWTTTTVHSESRVGFWTSLEAVDADTLFVSFHDVGADRLLFARSDDAGETWTERVIDFGTRDTGFYNALYAVDENTIYLAYFDDIDFTHTAKLARSVDGGDTWEIVVVATDPERTGDHVDLHGLGTDHLFMSWEGVPGYVVAESTDGGDSWRIEDVDPDGDHGPVFALDADHVVAAIYDRSGGNSMRFAATTPSTRPRLLGVHEADADGRATFELFVPPGLEGEPVYFHVLERDDEGACRVTNAVSPTF